MEDVQEAKFTKRQLLSSKIYADKQDLLDALLEENKDYTHKEVGAILESFWKGRC